MASSLIHLGSTTTTSTTSSITISSLSGYKNYKIIVKTDGSSTSSNTSLYLQWNGIASGYTFETIRGYSGGTDAQQETGQSQINLSRSATFRQSGQAYVNIDLHGTGSYWTASYEFGVRDFYSNEYYVKGTGSNSTSGALNSITIFSLNAALRTGTSVAVFGVAD